MTALHSQAPWIVGRTALVEHAADDFLNEITRQKPWRKARFEALLEDLDASLGEAAPLSALTAERAEVWQGALPEEDQADAADMLQEFTTYLHEWHWLT